LRGAGISPAIFSDLHITQNRWRHKAAHATFNASGLGVGIQNFCENFGLLSGGLGDGGARCFRSAPAKEKRQMSGAALAAAERPQEQEKQDGPLQYAAPVRAQNIFTAT
jgi:hypothetical protein